LTLSYRFLVEAGSLDNRYRTALRALAIAQPQNLTELREVKGIGEMKLERFGHELLALLKAEA